jgi:hypothetical protein
MLQPERRAQGTIGDGNFLAGTRIALAPTEDATAAEPGAAETPAGAAEAAVEELVATAAVLTLGGAVAARPVRRVVQRRLDHGLHPERALVTPVRVRAGALAPEVPRRDLLLPPEALLLFRDLPGRDRAPAEPGQPPVLVPVGALVNGTTIVQAPPAAALNWCALELDAHDVVLAENLPVATLRPESAEAPGRRARPCARLLLPGAELVALRARLAREAAAGPMLLPEAVPAAAEPEITDDETQALRLFVGGAEIPPEVEPEGGDYLFALPEDTGAVRLVSPRRASPAPRDKRRLGVAVMRLTLDGEELSLDGPELGRGFHPAEGNETMRWRWTDGRAWLVLPHSAATRQLAVKISDWHTQLKR